MSETQVLSKDNYETTTEKLNFLPITLESKDLLQSYIRPWMPECSDLSFANLFIWGTEGKMEYAEAENCLYIKLEFKGIPVFLWAPIPKMDRNVDYRKAVYTGIHYMQERGVEPTFRSVWEFLKERMLSACPELFAVPTDIAWDYVYDRESLATLKGKKLHGKRNHINKFLSLYPNYEYRKLDSSMIQDCIALYDSWRDEKEKMELSDERKSVLLALNHMEELGLTGGAIYIEDKLCAFTVGERLLPYMQLIHIEKGSPEVEGIYPMINQQYILHECEDVLLVNREEDMGIEGMRKAKRSYQPVKMIEKYLIATKDIATLKGIWGKSE